MRFDLVGNNPQNNQQNFFRNSKIRDDEGNLLVCYHGTTQPGFTEFNPQDSKSQFGKYKFNKNCVNYFTTSKNTAEGYTELGYEDNGNVYACYLNIVNPYIVNNETEDKMRSWRMIKDKNIRQKQIEKFETECYYWKSFIDDIDEYTYEDINEWLHLFNKELRPESYYGNEEGYYDLWQLESNGSQFKEHVIMPGYTLEDIFTDEDTFQEFKEYVIGDYDNEEYKEDFHMDIDEIIRWVLYSNSIRKTDYDGIIVQDIADVGPRGSLFDELTTDIITLKSPNQIKRITNENPTDSNSIDEDWIRYNANVNDRDVGDCVRRAISLAYNLDYEEVRKKLFSMARQKHIKNNDYGNIVEYLNELGTKWMKSFTKSDAYTVQEVCEDYPIGTYINLCYDTRSNSKKAHLVCIKDGDVYDSWDSRSWFTIRLWAVDEAKGTERNSENQDYSPIISDVISEIINKGFKGDKDFNKENYHAPYVGHTKDDLNSYRVCVYSALNDSQSKMIDHFMSRDTIPVKKNQIIYFNVDATRKLYFAYDGWIKFTPFDTDEVKMTKVKDECTKLLTSLMAVIRKYNRAMATRSEMRELINPHFSGDKETLSKMPKEAIPYITNLYKDIDREDGVTYTDYSLFMQPFENDPRQYDVEIHTSSLSRLKSYVKNYVQNFERDTEW